MQSSQLSGPLSINKYQSYQKRRAQPSNHMPIIQRQTPGYPLKNPNRKAYGSNQKAKAYKSNTLQNLPFNDNMSYKSTTSNVSTKSIRQRKLRGVSVNNQEQLENVIKKERMKRDHNQGYIERFIQQLDEKARKNLKEKFLMEINRTWDSWYRNQNNQMFNDPGKKKQLDDGLQNFQKCFQEQYELKSQLYFNQQKRRCYQNIIGQVRN
jgi:hypothetical protein